MTLLGHKTDIMFRKYIQRHDERLIEAAKVLDEYRTSKLTKGINGIQSGHNSVAVTPVVTATRSQKH
jgi:hypothetical protein